MTVYYKMQQMLLQNAAGFLLQNVTVLLQNVTVITKCDDYVTKGDSYQTKCGVYYKLRQYNNIFEEVKHLTWEVCFQNRERKKNC